MIRQVTARHESDPATKVEHKLRGSVEHRIDISIELPCGGPVARGKQVVAADRHLVTGRRDGQSRELPTGLGLKVGGLVREVLSDRSGRCGPRRLGFEREGYARAYLLIAGRWQDMVLNSLVNPAR